MAHILTIAEPIWPMLQINGTCTNMSLELNSEIKDVSGSTNRLPENADEFMNESILNGTNIHVHVGLELNLEIKDFSGSTNLIRLINSITA